MTDVLTRCGYKLVGGRRLLLDAQAASSALDELEGQEFDQLLVLQVTFTDASTVSEVACRVHQPLAIWSVREPRAGDRLRLNSFCGLNLASHSLSLQDRSFSWLYADPQVVSADVLSELFSGKRTSGKLVAGERRTPTVDALPLASAIRGSRIGRIGSHPVGFDTCLYDPRALKETADIEVADIALEELFAIADRAPLVAQDELRQSTEKVIAGKAYPFESATTRY